MNFSIFLGKVVAGPEAVKAEPFGSGPQMAILNFLPFRIIPLFPPPSWSNCENLETSFVYPQADCDELE